ncbi:MAG: fibronectin type III domain-containing protein, partial [bacterium]
MAQGYLNFRIYKPAHKPAMRVYALSLLFTGLLFFAPWLPEAQAAAPYFQAVGTDVSGTGSVSPPWPSHQAGDIGLLFVEAAGGEAISLTTPNGFVEVANSPRATGSGTAGTRLAVYWARATSGSMAAPVVADPGDHVYAVIITFRGVIPAGDPWDITVGGVKATPSVSVTAAGVTTTAPDTLIVLGVSMDQDSNKAFASAWTNFNLANITEQFDMAIKSGAGGGIAVMTGEKATAGATGDTILTVNSSVNAFLTIALKPIPAPVIGSITKVYASSMTANWSLVSGATGYTLAASVNSANPPSPIYASSTTLGNLSATVFSPALNSNTTYYLFVQANGLNNSSAWSAYPGTSTLANVPVFTNFTNVGAGSVRFNWSANGNPYPTTLYRVLTSTAPDPLNPAGAVVTTSNTYNVYLASSGLNANTTYYFRVTGINNNNVPAAYTTAQTTSTLANAPVFTNFTNIGSSSVQFNWSANGNPYPTTLYRVLTSTAPDPLSPAGAVVTTSDTYNVYLTTSGLNANTTYYFRVAGINKNNVPTSYTAAQGTSTLTNAPVFTDFTGVGTGSVQFNWSANGNPYPTTLYRVLTSTAPDPMSPAGAVVTTSDTYNVYLSTSGLNANTTYYFRVAGINKNNAATAYTAAQTTSTLANAPVFAAFTNMTGGNIRFNWSANGNSYPTTLYRVLTSTAPDPMSPAGAVVTTSDTYNVYLSTSGLNANTTYYFRVAGINNNNIPTSYAAAQGTSTLVAFAPVFTSFTNMGSSSVQFNWSANGNPYPGTLYRVLTSTAPDPLNPAGAVVTTSDTYNVYLASSGLNADTLYYFKMAGLNNNGVPTSYTTAKGTSTLLAFAPVFTDFTNMAEENIRFNWSANGNPYPDTLYKVLTSTAPDPFNPAGAAVTTSEIYTTYFNSSGLNTNTTYYFTVAGLNKNNVPTSYTTVQGTSTLAAQPSDLNFTGITDDTIQLSWSANNNPYPGTLYRVLTSTAPDPLSPAGAVVTTSDTYNVYLSTSGLNNDTDYYFRAAAVNNNGLATSFTAPVTAKTLPVGGLGAPVIGSITDVYVTSMTANWSLVDGATGYTLAASVNPDNPPSIYASSTTLGNLSATLYTPALDANTTYYLFVRSNGPGKLSAWSAYPGTSTLLANAPVFTDFTNVGTGAVRFNWSANGNPYPTTLYRVLTSTAPDPLSPAGAVVTTSDTYNVYLATSGLSANTTYYFRVAGINKNNVPTSYTATQTTSTLSNAPVFTNFTNVGTGSARFNWSANNNPYPGTLYRVLTSTAADPLNPAGAVVTTSDTYNVYLASSGLNSNTTYYFRAAGINNNNIPTSYTSAVSTKTLALPAPAITAITNVYTSSVTASWQLATGATGYTLAASVNPGNPPNPIYASSTTLGNLSATVFSPALAPNTTHYLFVRANGAGASSSWSAYPATSTLANIPL